MNETESYKKLPNTDTHNCFACSPINTSGLKMEFFTDEKTVFTELTVPDHLCGWNNVIHGGILSTILDEVMSWTALYLIKRITMTRTMTIDFLKPVYIGDHLKAEGRIVEVRRQTSAVLEAVIYDPKGEPCAKSSGTLALFSPALAKRMKVMDQASLDWFENVIAS